MEIRRLVAQIPGVSPVGVVIKRTGLAMAGTAEFIELVGVQRLRVLDTPQPSTRIHMSRPRTVAGLATDA